jgi:hypothetical protein
VFDRSTGFELNTLRKNCLKCHPEEPEATKDLCSSLNPKLLRFFASLRMTDFEGCR